MLGNTSVSVSSIGTSHTMGSSASSSSQFLNSDSVGRLARTFLAVAAQLKLERHGRLAEDIAQYDVRATELDQQAKRLEAFVFKERALVLRQKLYGASHLVVTESAKELGLQYSIVAMDLVRSGDTSDSLQLLEKAEVLTSSEVLFPDPVQRKQLLAVMYNNFGCYYKFLGKSHTALKYLQKALRIESSVPGCQNPAGTHLNVCALLSQMGRHRSALHHAQLAIHVLQVERDMARAVKEADTMSAAVAAAAVAAPSPTTPAAVSSPSLGPSATPGLSVSTAGGGAGGQHGGEASTPKEAIHGTDERRFFGTATSRAASTKDLKTSASGSHIGALHATSSSSSDSSESQNKTCLYIIALYNAAVELEHIGQNDQAVEQYKYALEVAKAELGPGHSLTESVGTTLKFARKSARKAAKRRSFQAANDRETEARYNDSVSSESLHGGSSSKDSKAKSATQFQRPVGVVPSPPPRASPSPPSRSPPSRHRPSQRLMSSHHDRPHPSPVRTGTARSSSSLFSPPTDSDASPRTPTNATWSATGGYTKSSARLPSAGSPRLPSAGAPRRSALSRGTVRSEAGGFSSTQPRDATWSASTGFSRSMGPL